MRDSDCRLEEPVAFNPHSRFRGTELLTRVDDGVIAPAVEAHPARINPDEYGARALDFSVLRGGGGENLSAADVEDVEVTVFSEAEAVGPGSEFLAADGDGRVRDEEALVLGAH